MPFYVYIYVYYINTCIQVTPEVAEAVKTILESGDISGTSIVYDLYDDFLFSFFF